MDGAVDTSPLSRRRRLSDPSAMTDNPPTSGPLAVRSADGTRWLPAPDALGHREGRLAQSDAAAEPVEAGLLPQHQCDAAVCALVRVFETTELLDTVLRFLNTRDVLSMRRISKRWNTAIQSSPYLRLHFFVHPQWDRPSSDYRLLPLSLHGVTVENDKPIELGQWIKVSMTLEAAKHICPEPKRRVRARSIFEGMQGGLGRRSSDDAWPASNTAPSTGGGLKHESLLITQPPLLGMQAYIVHEKPAPTSTSVPTWSLSRLSMRDDASASREPPAVAKLSCDSGITLGFLAETAQELLAVQVGGPSNATVKVVFKAIVSFGPADASPRRSARRNIRTVTRIG